MNKVINLVFVCKRMNKFGAGNRKCFRRYFHICFCNLKQLQVEQFKNIETK